MDDSSNPSGNIPEGPAAVASSDASRENGNATPRAPSQPPMAPETAPESFDDTIKNSDGSYDVEKMVKLLKDEHSECVRLRETVGKMASQKQENYGIDDLFPDLSHIMETKNIPEEEKSIMADIVKKFSDIGISQKQALEVFKGFQNYVSSDTEVAREREQFYDTEIKKLGDDRDTILSSLRNFSDTMVANKVWDDTKKAMFYGAITTADSARMFYDAISNLNLLRAGNFSNATSAPPQPNQYSREEQIFMYKKAFEMAKSNPTDGDIEVKRLDRLFGIK
jgi:hypothetical protein